MFHCVPCDRNFVSQEAFDQHVQCSQAHALRRLTNQLDVDRKLASQASKSNRKALSTQSQPGRQNVFVSQSYPLGSRQYCKPCNMSFKDKSALNQHLQHSKVHNAAILHPLQVQTIRVQTTYQESSILGLHQHFPSPTDTIASNSRPSQALNYDEDNNSMQKSPGSVMSASQIIALYEQLSRHCHSPEDLLKNKYLLSPYSEADIAGLRKCKKCGRLAKKSQNNRCCFHPGKLTTTVGVQPHVRPLSG